MRLTVYILVTMALVSPAGAISAFFQRDLGVKGFMRYCEFSDGNVYTVNSTELCPMSIDVGNSYSFGGGSSVTGFKAGEYQDGMTKVCVYDVLGDQKAIRVDSFELCPLTQEF